METTLKIMAKADTISLKMEIERNDFAIALKTWRLRTNLTQAEAGKIFGVSRWAVMKMEAAKPVSWETAYRTFVILQSKLEKECN